MHRLRGFQRASPTLAATAAAVSLALGCASEPPSVAGVARLLEDGSPCQAAAEMKQLVHVASPATADSDPLELRTRYLRVLTACAANRLEPWMDDEAAWSYREGQQLAPDPSTAELVGWSYAMYFAATYRPGRALPLIRRRIEFARMRDLPVREMTGLDGLASVMDDMGQTALRDLYRGQALAVGFEHFYDARYRGDPDAPSTDEEWAAFRAVLAKRMRNVALKPTAADELFELDVHVRGMAQRTDYDWRADAVYALALEKSGEHERARERMEAIRHDLKSTTRSTMGAPQLTAREQSEWHCTDAAFSVEIEDWKRSRKLTALCLQGMRRGRFQRPSPFHLLHRAKALEATGELERARAYYQRSSHAFDRTRESFEVGERTLFFAAGGGALEAARGWARTQASLAASSGDASDFTNALVASESVRARQLGDYVGPDDAPPLNARRAAALPEALPPDVMLVSYVFTPERLVVLAFDREEQIVTVASHDEAGTNTLLARIARSLSNSGSDRGTVRRDLEAAGELFLSDLHPMLAGKRRILVVPDGRLALVPFDLFVNPETGRSIFEEGRSVQIVPTLRLLAASPSAPATSGLFAVGDPVYAGSYSSLDLPKEDLVQARRGIRMEEVVFAPLPETRSEIESIHELVGDERSMLLLGEDALESRVKATDLRPYRILHFATHGVLANEFPGISEPGLALGVEEGEDGLLTASEAMQLDIDAELTVLSACKTGSGQIVTGEGVLGMSRSFLIAGSRSVLVSLWAVDSRSTEELMVAFYQGLHAGLGAPEALRRAKASVLRADTRDGAFRGVELGAKEAAAPSAGLHPFFWSAFVLVGS